VPGEDRRQVALAVGGQTHQTTGKAEGGQAPPLMTFCSASTPPAEPMPVIEMARSLDIIGRPPRGDVWPRPDRRRRDGRRN
jgi:hypothetical protein